MADSTKVAYIAQNIGGIDEPLLTVRPRYVKDQLAGIRGRRSRFRLVSPTSSRNIQSSGIANALRKELSPKGSGFTSMLVQNVSYGFAEKTQINETFGDSITVYAFGMAPLVLNIQGVVVDDLDNNWFVKLIHVYNDHIRATKLAKHFEMARFDMPDASYLGSVLALNIDKNSGNDALVSFSMQFLVRNFQFYSNQTYSDGLAKEKPIEAVAKDGSFSYKTLKDGKNIKQLLGGALFSGATAGAKSAVGGLLGGVTGGIESSLVSNYGFLGQLASKQITKAANRAVTKALDKQIDKLGKALSLKGLLSKGLVDNVGSEALKESRAYKLTIIGAYSRELYSAGDETVTSKFLTDASEYIRYTDGAVALITGQGGQSRDEKKKSLTNTYNIGKKILDLAKGKRELNIDSIGELGEIGKDIKGTLGKVAGLPTTLADGIGGLIQRSPLSNLPFVGGLLGGIAADQAEKYFRTKIPQKASDFLKIPAQEPTKSRVIRVSLGE